MIILQHNVIIPFLLIAPFLNFRKTAPKMLYLEDYLEMIEHLPIELRDRFTEMREIDLGVENTVDSLQERQKQFFLEIGI